tara:strand:- start:510 stop:752 length:243 start_codon:yes stop_codon:yes gene_type:complete
MYKLKELKTESLILKPMIIDFCEDYQSYFNDYRIIRYLSIEFLWSYPENTALSRIKQKTGAVLVKLMDATFVDSNFRSAE